MNETIKSLSSEALKEKLLKQGFAENVALTFYDDNVNGESFLQLSKEDLLEKFRNNEGLVKRLQMFIKSSVPKPVPRNKLKSASETPKKSSLDASSLRSQGNVNVPRPVQICKAEGDTERYVLDEVALRNILCRDDLKDKPVAVYSLAGSFRKGKSFMLNLFMRHLQHDRSSNWLQDKEASLRDGFRCKAGTGRCTEGLWMWNKPFVVTDENGKEIVVYLMDTQGTSDLKTGMTGNSIIFALSTLISSVQIFNLSGQVEAHDLQLLKLFTDYGKMATESTKNESKIIKPFQSLIFLIRDWSDTDYEDGMEGGREYLNEVLKVKNDNIEELKIVRENIKESFENVECCLMPEPGKNITKGGTKTEQTLTIKEIEDDFLNCVDNFVRYLFHERVAIKQVNGEYVTGNDLLNLTISYCNAFSSEDIPKVDTIYEASAKAAIQKTMEKAKTVYSESILNKLTGYFHEDDELKKFHEESKKESLDFYDRQRKMGDKKFLEKVRREFESILDSNFQLFQKKNNKDKAKAKQFWIKKMKKMEMNYYNNMRDMWKPNGEDVIKFASKCDKSCRNKSLLSFNELLEDYPEKFMEECRVELEAKLDQLLDYIKKYFLKLQKQEIKLSENANLKAKIIYVDDMDKLFAVKVVKEEQIENAHKKFLKKALDHFHCLIDKVSEKCITSAKEKTSSEINHLKMKYLEENKKKQQAEAEKILKTITKAVECYKTLMNAVKQEFYICEKELEQKHKFNKAEAIAKTCGKEGEESYDRCYQRAAAGIESEFSNFQRLNTVQKNEAIRNFNQQAEICLQNYKNEMQKIVKTKNKKVMEEEFVKFHNKYKALMCAKFYKALPKREPKQEFEHVYKQLGDDISDAWKEIHKYKQKHDKSEADLVIETAIMNCLNIMKEFMNNRHIKEEALQRLYKLAKVNRDIEFKRLDIPIGSPTYVNYAKQFEEHYRKICEENKANRYRYLQINYDPYEDINNRWCTIS